MKDIIDKLEHPNSQDDDLVSNETESDLGKKLSEKTKELKAKERLLDQANKDKRRLAKDLAEAQKKKENENMDDEEDDKISKLSNILKNKNSELKKATDDVRKVTETNKVIQEKFNDANNTIATLETKNTRL